MTEVKVVAHTIRQSSNCYLDDAMPMCLIAPLPEQGVQEWLTEEETFQWRDAVCSQEHVHTVAAALMNVGPGEFAACS